jgi:hypothetical protein
MKKREWNAQSTSIPTDYGKRNRRDCTRTKTEQKLRVRSWNITFIPLCFFYGPTIGGRTTICVCYYIVYIDRDVIFQLLEDAFGLLSTECLGIKLNYIELQLLLCSTPIASDLTHVSWYLAEFEYRFNRRYRLRDMIERLTYVGLQTPTMPYRLLRLAEDHR